MNFSKHPLLLSVFLVVFCWQVVYSQGQEAIIKGQIVDSRNNEVVPLATVVIQGTTIGTTTDLDGNYTLRLPKAGTYNLQVSYVGYKTKLLYEVEVSLARPLTLNISLEEDAASLEEVVITASSSFAKTDESPVSLRSIGTTEIKRFPGANRDISNVLQALPGVASSVAFRNDLIIRGGAPNENRFYIDGIEVPVINHFATQGASGGPVGLLNVNLLQNVDFYSGAFPSNRGNALSSVIEFTQRDGSAERWGADFVLSATDIGLNFEGPISQRSTLNFSVRRSYLQFLFSALGLPFLPTYNDYQFKYKHKISDKLQLSIISLGALDEFGLNLNANETEEQRYILNNLPVNNQWNYSIGARLDWFRKNGFYTFVLSRSMLNNEIFKYPNNDESLERILDYRSQEIENKLRLERYLSTAGGWKITYGIGYELIKYNNRTRNRIDVPFTVSPTGVILREFQSDLAFNTYAVFGQASRRLANDKLGISIGFRMDGADYAPTMENPLAQFSPRLSLSYSFAPRWAFNFNTGIYYQRAPLTVMGYREGERLVNADNGLRYIRNQQVVGGLEYNLPKSNSRLTVEGFLKVYDRYPFLLQDSISLANLGSDFGVIGNAPVSSTSEGRSYGVEFLYQRKLTKGVYALVSYTWVRSEFQDKNGRFIPSAWDNRHIINLTGGFKFGKDWELGARFLLSGAAPFTPFDEARSLTRSVWDVTGRGVPDYNRLNEGRAGAFHNLNLRIDKKWFFSRWSFNAFFDIQNAYGFQFIGQPFIDVQRDATGNPIVDPNNPDRYLGRTFENATGTTLPSIGLIIEL
ncbi:TonB-dependent receptor [Eisenibacter elegans]|uniref:TonB-dependent receptor n=1 Tax=Eisenibacter elegans TaxID=997 RepID=UPI00040719FE|nr:TonB-dependent receptor [Eisenibacter elegans]